MMGTYDTYKGVMTDLQARLQVLIDASGAKMFDEVEYGRRGDYDEELGGAYILPDPRSILIQDREFEKTWHQWFFNIYFNFIGAGEEDTFDAIIIKLWKIYDTLMEVDVPAEGKGYNRTLNNRVTDLEIYEMHVVPREYEARRGSEQIAMIRLYVNLRI